MEKPLDLADILETLRPRRMRFALLMAVAVVVSLVVASVLPELYRATANILIQEPEIPADLVDVYQTTAAEQRIASLTRAVLTRENLGQLVEQLNPYPNGINADSSTETLTGELQRNIYIEPVSEELVHPKTGKAAFVTTSFMVSFDHESAETAQIVAARLAQLFLAEDRKSRESRAVDTTAFMAEEAARLRERVAEVEQELAVFKRTNINLLPEYAYGDRKQIEVVNQELAQVQRTITSLEDRKRYLESQLSSNDALAQARAELAAARQKYSEIHPDVVRLKTVIKQLQEDPSKGMATAYSGKPGDGRSIELQNEMQAVNASLRENRMQLAQFQKDVDALQTNLAQAPEVERQYLALQRNYEHATEQYDAIRQKMMRAEMAQQLEAADMAGQLAMLRPPLVPVDPISPNRPAIVLLGIIAGLGMCFGYGGIVAYTDRSVRGVRGLTRALTAPPIGVIPYIETSGGLFRKWRAGLTTVILPITIIVSAMFLIQVAWLPFG